MAEAYLAHYGVKGMKWGVRNAETLRKYGVKPDHSTADYILKKGTKAQRMVGFGVLENDATGIPKFRKTATDDEIEKLKKHGDDSFTKNFRDESLPRTYVSIDKADKKLYKDWWTRDATGDVFELKLSAVSDLKIAGGKKVTEEFLRIDGRHDLAEQLSKAKISDDMALTGWLAKKDPSGSYRGLPNDLNIGEFTDSHMSGVYADKITQSLIQQGYAGMKDMWDGNVYSRMAIGGSYESKGKTLTDKALKKINEEARDPTIIFDPQKNLKIDEVVRYKPKEP